MSVDMFAIAAVFGTVIIGIVVGVCGKVITTVVRVFADYRLKHAMIERGMSPEDIDRVLHAGSDKPPLAAGDDRVPPVRKPEPGWHS